MSCGTCGNRAKAAAEYPRDAVMPDGSTVRVDSAADERVKRARFQQSEREKAKSTGYTVRR